jgi:hypothetical protein
VDTPGIVRPHLGFSTVGDLEPADDFPRLRVIPHHQGTSDAATAIGGRQDGSIPFDTVLRPPWVIHERVTRSS